LKAQFRIETGSFLDAIWMELIYGVSKWFVKQYASKMLALRGFFKSLRGHPARTEIGLLYLAPLATTARD
jgi:hypothetical protein